MATVLLATDGSPASVAAARAGIAFTGPSASYLLVRAEVFPPLTSPTGRISAAATLEPVVEEQRRTAERELASVAESLEVETERLVVDGPAVTAILRTAEERDVDLIVVGAQGRSAVERVLVGSVSTAILHESSRPVLVVPS